MKSFQEYLLEVKRVFRADPRQIRPGKKARRYDFDPFGNSAPAGSLPSEEMTRQRGLFAAPKDEMVPYLAGRDISFAYVQPTRTKNKRGFQRGTVYYSDANREKVQSRRPVVTGYSTKKQGFKKIGSGEYFRPGQRVPRPVSREEIQDPIAYMQKYVNVKFVPDLGKVATTLHKNSRSGKYSLTINSVEEKL